MAVVLLHPLPFDGAVWTDVVACLDEEPIVVDSLYRLGESLGEWATAIADLAGPGRHTLVGNSIGASCAAEVAYRAPDRVRRLVLVGGKLGHRPEPTLRDAALSLLDRGGLTAAWAEYWAPLFGPDTPPRSLADARRACLALDVADVARGVAVFHSRPDRSNLRSRWDGALDVVSGALDPAPTPQRAAESLAGFTRGRRHVLDGVGHYVLLEAPRRLAEVIGLGPG